MKIEKEREAPEQPQDKRLAEIRERLERRRGAIEFAVRRDIEYMLNLLQQPATSERKCTSSCGDSLLDSDRHTHKAGCQYEPIHAADCSIWLPMDRTCDCGAVRVAPATSERCGECVECHHSTGVDARGRCMEVQRDPGGSMVYCGCKCVFPTTEAPACAWVQDGSDYRWYKTGCGRETDAFDGGYCTYCGKVIEIDGKPLETRGAQRNLGTDTNFPLSDTLTLMVSWLRHLHEDHNCDCEGWEQRSCLIAAAERYALKVATTGAGEGAGGRITCSHQRDYGEMPYCTLPSGHAGDHDYNNSWSFDRPSATVVEGEPEWRDGHHWHTRVEAPSYCCDCQGEPCVAFNVNPNPVRLPDAPQDELQKLRQAMGWIGDAADAAYIEDPENKYIHDIFNIVTKTCGLTRRLSDEYQRFDESTPTD